MKLGALLHSKLFIGIAAGVVAAAAAVTGILLMHHDEAYRVIKVFDKTGTSVVTRPKVGDIDPYIGMNLESGDTVCTFKESTMHVNLDDTKYLLLEPETKIELEASGNSKDNKTKIVLKSGSVLNEITEPLSSDSSYEVSAPKATMAVHGTSFRVSIEKDENGDYITRLYVFHGKVKVTLVDENGNETGQTAIVGEGKCIVIKTVKNEKTGKDAAIDGTSFFVSDGANGKLEKVKDGDDPTMDIDYYSIPYDILKEVFTTDKEDEIKLDPEVLRKIIEAMNRRDGTETSGETSPPEQTTEPEQTTSNNEETTAPQGDPDQTSTTTQADPVVTTVPVTTSSANSTTTTTTSSKKDPAPDPDPDPDPEPKNEYSVKFYDFDGTLLSTQTVTDGTAAIEPTSYTKSYVDSATGSTMEFAGWDKQFDSVTGDLIIKPVYKAKAKYSVKFYDYDGTLLSTQTIEEGMPATAPSNVTASYVSSGVHYSFRAWDNSYTNISADLIVKPTYYRSYEVQFFSGGTQIGSTQVIAEGKSATEPTEFDKTIDVADGKQSRFSKWDKAFAKITAPISVNAVFDTYYQVTFFDYDDNALSATYVKEKTAATAPTNYTKTYTDEGVHYTFTGWDADFSSITEATSVHPTYSESYEVKFFGYDGEQIGETQVVASGKSATEPTEFDKTIDVAEGKQSRFSKWDKAFAKITAPISVNAVFDTYYQVTFFDYNDNELSATYVKEKTAATAPTNYTKTYEVDGTHFTFSGWDADFSSITKVTSVHPTYSESYEVKFFGYGGEQIGETQVVASGKSATEPTEFDKTIDVAEGKQSRFAKWDKAFAKITAPTEINAVFDTYYQVTFFDYNDKELSATYVKEKTAATAPTNYTNTYTADGTHFTFSGWDTNFSSITKVTSVHPTYSESYEVKFFGYDGEQIGETQIVASGKSATEPTEFDKTIDVAEGKQSRFSKWDKAFNKITAPISVNAVFDTYYLVTFFDYDDKELSATYVKEKTAATAPTNYTKTYTADGTHYTFSGWDTNFSSITKVTSVHPTYSESYEVKFFGYDGEQIGETQIVAKNASATEPTEFDKTIDVAEGKQSRFSKWDKAFAKITAPTEINAVFDTYYQVTFYDYNDEELSATYVKEKTAATAPTNYTKTYEVDGVHYTFSGWDTDFSSITKVTTVHPTYSESYEVKFFGYDGEQIGETQIVASGKSATEPTEFDKTIDVADGKQSRFSKWDKAFNKITAPTEINAVFDTYYQVTFYDYNDTSLASNFVKEKTAATAPTNYTKTYTTDGIHYTFTGWDADFSSITKVTSVHPTYSESYEVKFFGYDGEQIGETQVVASGKSATEPTEFDKTIDVAEGKQSRFAKWDKAFNKITAPISVNAVFDTYYQVTFFDYDDTSLSSNFVKEKTAATAPTNYTKTYTADGVHYTFTGWDADFSSITTVTSVHPTYSESYEVKFFGYDGEQIGETQVVAKNASATEPTEFDKTIDVAEGKQSRFSKWDKAFNKITAPTEINAVFDTYYQVTFYDYNDEELSATYVKEKTAATAPTNYTKTYTADGIHYTFTGWDADFSSITKVTTVHPMYSESYEVKFFGYDGEQIGETQIVASGKSATEPTEFDKTIDVADGKQSRFAKWDKAFNKITAPISVNAVFDTYYQVTFFDYDGTSLSSNFVKEKTAATAPTNYTKTYTADGTHYTFTGWDADFSSITKVTSVHPTYSESYEVKFFGYDGEQIGETQVVAKNASATEPTEFDKTIDVAEGKQSRFSKWDKAFNKITAPTEINAVFDTYYQVTFYDYNDKELSATYVKEKTAATAPTNYTKTYEVDGVHYTFSGWDADFSSITKVTSVHPTYSESYEVKFFGYGGEQIGETQVVAKNASATEPTEFDKTIDVAEGKQSRFSKWDKAFNKITAPISVNAVFDTYYQVTFYDYNDKALSDKYVKEKTAATAPTNYTKTYTVDGIHYTFSGWDADFSSITKVTSVHPTYSESYEVKFFGYDGEQIGETQVVASGKSATEPTEFDKTIDVADGKQSRFSKWDKAFSKITAPISVNAVFDTYYQVTFYDYNDTSLSSNFVKEKTAATAPTNYTKTYTADGTHFTFSGWDADFSSITKVTSVHPTYSESYEVKFFGYGGEQIGETQVVASGESATEPTEFDKTIDVAEGKQSRFSKWDKAFAKITAPTSVNAVFDTYYQVTFFDYDDNALSATYVKEKTAATAPTNYTESYDVDGIHFTFKGWDTDFSKITKKITVRPEYNENYEVRFYDYYGELIGEPQIVAKGEDAAPPTVGTDIPKTIETSDGELTFKEWTGSYENIQESTEITAHYEPMVYYNLHEMQTLSTPTIKQKQAFKDEEITLPDTGAYSHLEGYNAGWFHSYSGLKPDTSAPITSYKIEQGGEDFVLLNYFTVPMTVTSNYEGEPVTYNYSVTIYRHNDYGVLIKGSETEEAVNLRSPGYDTVYGFRVKDLTFHTKDGSHLTYDEFTGSDLDVTQIETISAGNAINIVDTR